MTDQNQEFDVNAFMNESIDGQLDTAMLPIPEGEYMGQIGTDEKAIDIATGISKKNDKPWMRADIQITLTDPNLAILLKKEDGQRVIARYGVMIDLNEQGKFDIRPQRNVNIGKLRDAVGQNKPGPWNFGMLKGQPVKVKIKHETYEGNIQSKVVAVTKAV